MRSLCRRAGGSRRGIIPPRAVSFLLFENVASEMGNKFLLLLWREHLEAFGGVVEAVVIEVA